MSQSRASRSSSRAASEADEVPTAQLLGMMAQMQEQMATLQANFEANKDLIQISFIGSMCTWEREGYCCNLAVT